MRYLRMPFVSLAVIVCLAGAGVADDTPEKPLTLMGMLSEWMYPDAKFGGATSGDAAVSDISAIKSQAILTTPDAVDKVLAFYLQKLNVDVNGRNLDATADERITTDRSVLVQNVSGDESPSLYVIAINGPKSSTTLVISRAEGEEMTRIAWSNYRQLWP